MVMRTGTAGPARWCAVAGAVAVLGLAATTAPADAAPGIRSARAAGPTVNVMTWNACANDPKPASGSPVVCTNSRNTTETAGKISWHMKNHYVGGKLVTVDVVLLQEVCRADIARLSSFGWLRDWYFRFVPITQRLAGSSSVKPKPCRRDDVTGADRGSFGIAIGVDRPTSWRAPYYFAAHPSGTDRWGNDYQHRVLLCGTVAAWDATVCDTHLSPHQDNDEDGAIRSAQVREMLDQVGDAGRVITGGDLNTVPPDSATGTGDASPLAPLYSTYQGCDQARYGGRRDGEGTFQLADGSRVKLDYLFSDTGADQTCEVTDNRVASSDHRPLVDILTLA